MHRYGSDRSRNLCYTLESLTPACAPRNPIRLHRHPTALAAIIAHRHHSHHHHRSHHPHGSLGLLGLQHTRILPSPNCRPIPIPIQWTNSPTPHTTHFFLPSPSAPPFLSPFTLSRFFSLVASHFPLSAPSSCSPHPPRSRSTLSTLTTTTSAVSPSPPRRAIASSPPRMVSRPPNTSRLFPARRDRRPWALRQKASRVRHPSAGGRATWRSMVTGTDIPARRGRV